jgi:hypothetical protein
MTKFSNNDRPHPDIRMVFQYLGFREGGIELIGEYVDEDDRFIWYPDANEIFDKHKNMAYGSVEFVMEIRNYPKDKALNWLKNNGLV